MLRDENVNKFSDPRRIRAFVKHTWSAACDENEALLSALQWNCNKGALKVFRQIIKINFDKPRRGGSTRRNWNMLRHNIKHPISTTIYQLCCVVFPAACESRGSFDFRLWKIIKCRAPLSACDDVACFVCLAKGWIYKKRAERLSFVVVNKFRWESKWSRHKALQN